jgi:phosphoribosylanthranilate isomerase
MTDHSVAATGPEAVAATRVKICGITRLEDAQFAAEAGAWALGMVFHQPSPRRCALPEAMAIGAALRRKVELCGVFVNTPLDEIAAVADQAGLTLVQLHGDEGPAFCAEVARRTGAHVIKAVQIADNGDVHALDRFHTDYPLADTRPTSGRARGGTGLSFDWGLLAARRSKVPLILSGGISAENAIAAIEQVHPFALDSASGTEAAPGRKDPARVQALIDAAGRAPTHA